MIDDEMVIMLIMIMIKAMLMNFMLSEKFVLPVGRACNKVGSR